MYQGRQTVIATISDDDSDYSNYRPYTVSFDRLPLPRKDYLPWAIYTSPEGSERRIEIEKDIAEYNAVIEAFLVAPGLLQSFQDQNLIICQQQVEERWGRKLSEKLFSLDDYFFIQRLRVVGDKLVGTGESSPEYEMTIPKIGVVSFTIDSEGGIYYGYPKGTRQTLKWNRANDERDFTYQLWEILDEYCVNCDDYNDYACWEQGRDSMRFPDEKMVKCLCFLEDAGYVDTYTVVPEKPCAAWYNAEKTSGTFDFMVLDECFIENEFIMTEIKSILRYEPTT